MTAYKDEIIDIIDENDNIIAKDTCSNIHNKHLLHRATTMFVFRDNKYKILAMQKRANNIRAPGKLDLGGGHVKSGETYEETTLKEFYEEFLSNKIQPKINIELLFKRIKDTDNYIEMQAVFRTIYDGEFYPNKEEVQEIIEKDIKEWIALSISKPEIFTEHTILALKEYKEKVLRY